MTGVSRVNQDTAGGLINGALVSTVNVNSKPITVKGAAIVAHGSGPHAAPVMVGSSSTVFAGGIPICREGDAASCGHTASGSSNVNSN